MRVLLLALGVAATLVVLGGSGCGDGKPAALKVELMPLPPRLLVRCRSSRALEAACPALVPHVPHRLGGGILHGLVGTGPTRVNDFVVFDLQHGVPRERPELDRPPALLHLTIVGGSRPNQLFAGMPYPDLRGRRDVRDGADLGTRRAPLFFGPRVWGDHRGELFLAPSYPFGGQIGGHLTFWWRSGSHGYVISIHAWEPLTECSRVLRAIVASTRR